MKCKITILFSLLLLCESLNAQTGGPGQPEFMQFQQAGTSDLVNPSSGSFSYQIPLFSIGGYPMNLTYQSGIQMEDVASSFGLGWNCNAGSIVRTVRSFADDFQNDVIIKEFSMKENKTFGGKLGVDLEIAGLPLGLSLGADLGIFYNNYKGWGLAPSLRGSLSANYQATEGMGGSASLGLGISVNSQEGVDRYSSYSVGLKLGKEKDDGNMNLSFGKTTSVNSIEGKKSSINFGLSYTRYNNMTEKGVNKGGKVESRGQSTQSLLGFSSRSYLNNSFKPDIDYPYDNISGTFSGTFGFDAYYVDPNFRFTGYFSIQKLRKKSQDFFAMGSMYETENRLPNTLMDFTREKRLPYFIGESKILPIPIKMPDVFNLNAQGLSMTFSLLKNDVGIVGDASAIMNSIGGQIGSEVNLGGIFKAGGNFGATVSSQESGRWSPQNLLLPISNLPLANFKPLQSLTTNNTLYQQSSFKNHGEINKFDNTLFSQLGEYDPIRFDVASESGIKLSLNNGSTLNSELINQNQPVRQTTINYLTSKEATAMGLDKTINYYKFNNVFRSDLRISTDRKEHHISEISVTQPDGMKYVFGMPLYNITQKEISFNVSPGLGDPILNLNEAKNLVKYTSTDNSVGNRKGIDNFFESTTTPAYATQFLITAVLSPDYRDITNNGISDDDIGNYVKFNYFKEDFNYNWRTPFAEYYASYSANSKTDKDDDRGNIVFGTKELGYIHSIESKTEIAEYYYSKREDGYGVKDENGGKNSAMYLRKVDSIKIFSKHDRRLNGNSAVPVKVVHFYYDYSLCKNIDNGNTPTTGKLTLKKVSFTYENSQKGKLTPYEFEYGNSTGGVFNPDYDIRDVNKWGSFQENPSGAFSDCDNTNLSNIDFPYSSQDKSIMDQNAYAWNLTDITIPGSGKIKVDYEANDYSYIQNKSAGQMFMVSGFTNIGDNVFYDVNTNYLTNRIHFELYDPVSSKEELRQLYIQDIESGYLYYKFLVNLRSFSTGNSYEYVSGYAKIADYGLAGNFNGKNYAYIDLMLTEIDDHKPSNGWCNPILKNALQFMRINRNKLIHDNSPSEPTDLGSFAAQLKNSIHQLATHITAFTKGVNKDCMDRSLCKNIDLNKSFIRLYNPRKKKISGGSRVKEISIDDNFSNMTDNTHTSKSYTTSYDYTTEEKDPVTGITKTISSGVADYEPLIGGDEISLKQPIIYHDRHQKAPDNEYFVETPVNESLFPSPRITYGKVTQITNYRITDDVGKTGKIVNEFFTAKDKPVKVGNTVIDEKRDMTEFNAVQVPFVAIDQQHDFAMVSQGYSIELNNMSGLPKATWVYDEQGNRISGEVMEYFPDNNNFTTIDRLGNINYNTKLGLSAEYTIDGRESRDKSVTVIKQGNLNMSMVAMAPVFMFMPLFSKMTEEKQFRSVVINKVIEVNVLLKSKTVFDQTSSVTTENLAFDEITGEALLTKTTNEFNDTLYSFKYPAWWMYDGMGPSFENTKLKLEGSASNLSSFYPFLKVGDVLGGSDGSRLWVTNPGTFVDDNGSNAPLSSVTDYQVHTSGAKNLLSLSAGQVVTWNYNPLSNVSRINFDQSKILNSSAVEYYDDAVVYCDTCLAKFRNGKNNFLLDMKGNWKPKKSWYYLTDRTPGDISSGLTNIKEQGLFENYSDFWTLPNPNWTINSNNWDWKEMVNLTDVDGRTIETEDRIGRKVTSLFGYKNTLMTAQVSNSGYNEAHFDGFEDYLLTYCDSSIGTGNMKYLTKRMKIINGNPVLSRNESHTGKYSLEVTNSITFSGVPPKECLSGKPCYSCIGGFYPENVKDYIFSCWVKVNNPDPILSNSDASVLINCNNSQVGSFTSEGPVIEGWQRVSGKFTTLSGSNQVNITLNKGNAATFFDDIRIFPADGNMVSYVYDDVNSRLTNILDGNNYFTKSEYNNQGELIRIKKETEKGIVTMEESQNALAKKKP